LTKARCGCGSRRTATAIDVASKRITARRGDEPAEAIDYDRLIVATGADPVRPRLPGTDLPGVHVLHHMDQAFTLDHVIRERDARSVLIIGAGYIGLEMAEAFCHRGLEVTVVERLPEVLPTVDPGLGSLVRGELTVHGVAVHTDTTVRSIEAAAERLRVRADPDFAEAADVVLISVGVRPNSALLERAGAELGSRGAVAVDSGMATSLPDVWAAGDCVHPPPAAGRAGLPAARNDSAQARTRGRPQRGRRSAHVRRFTRHARREGVRPRHRPDRPP
jgi:NADPH-dependent 2,4-dienoyl-CoA reductase/sulfur reductase-like enzyme